MVALVEFSALQLWWLTVVGLAMLPVLRNLLPSRRTWLPTTLLCVAFFVGVSSQLALTEPRWYQTIQVDLSWRWHQALLATIVLQLLGVILAFSKTESREVARSALTSLGLGRVALLVVSLVLISTPLMDEIGRPLHFLLELSKTSTLLILNLGTLFAIACSIPAAQSKSFPSLVPTPSTQKRVTLLTAAFVLLSTSGLLVFGFEQLPHVPDEVAYLFQAKTFLSGHLTLPAPPPELAAALKYDFIDLYEGKQYSIFPPGWPAVLALGTAVGSPFWVNPLLAVLCVFLANKFFTTVTSPQTATIATIALGSSPWFLGASASLMSHTLTIALTLAAWVWLIESVRAQRISRALFAGLLMGIVFLTRPLDGVIVGTLTGVVLLANSNWKPIAPVLSYGIGCILTGALIFPYHAELVGDPLLTPINHYFNELWGMGSNRLGFAADIGPPGTWGGIDIDPGHSVKEALLHTHQNLYSLNFELLGGAGISLCLAFAHLIWGKKSKTDYALLSVAVAVAVATSFYWFSGAFFIGPRYWFVSFLPLLYLSARGATTFVDRFEAEGGISNPALRVAVPVLTLCVFALISFTSWRGLTRYHEFRGFHTDYRALAADGSLDQSLIFIHDTSAGDFGSALLLNPLHATESGPFFVRDLGASHNQKVANLMPHRSVAYATGRSKNRDGDAQPARLLSSGSTVNPVDVILLANPLQRYQTWRGMEVAHNFYHRDENALGKLPTHPVPQEIIDAMLDDAVNHLGLSAFDFANAILMLSGSRPGLEPTNDNDDPFVLDSTKIRWNWFDPYVETILLPFKERVEANGDPFVLTMSAIAWGAWQWNEPADDPGQEYAEIMMACLDRLRDVHGIVPDYLAPYNEPDLTGTSTETPAVVVRGIKALADRMKSAGYETKLRYPDAWKLENAIPYLDLLEKLEPELMSALGVFSFHGYESPRDGMNRSNLNSVRDRAAALGIPTVLSEWWSPDYHPPHIQRAMTEGDVVQYQPYILSDGSNEATRRGLYRLTYSGGSEPLFGYTGFERAADWYEIYQYAAFIRPGDVRIDIQSDDDAVLPVAFEKPNGSHVVVVVNEHATPRRISLAGIRHGTYGVSVTSPNQKGQEQTPLAISEKAAAILDLPPQSVTSIYPRN